MTKSEDKRIQKSKHAIKEAFWQLLETKDFSKISIKEILALAQVNRATFYKYFANKFALLESVEQDLISEFEQTANQAPQLFTKELDSAQLENYYHEFINYIYHNKQKFSVLLSSASAPAFISKLTTADQKIWQQKHLTEYLAIPENYASAALTGLIINLIVEWVKTNFQKSPQEFSELLATIISPIITNGIFFNYQT
ncbi:TetR/AcrR family transcriptional regulator [Lactobacillus sp. ESL0684]|uniref:TetR/AcrR family transcriptional regulator n=1 Tax=Lactobacillus sp. ESL0684 TaxID=2983213 RepID=UPI0023F791E3|nr:TetR/AcrR family transcriptional regulator [Lactobacillus sp. ESL0684]WEV43928.1 TetR/AcrR family transcriptional regulator [Lactobacillus sp. ESL0684]